MKKIIILLIFFYTFSFAFSQDSTKHVNFTASYYCNFPMKPGLKIGMDYTFLHKYKTKIKQRKSGEVTKNIQKQFFVGLNSSYYVHPKVYSALFVYSDLGYKHTFGNGLAFNFAFGLGDYVSFMPETYTVMNDGSLRKTNVSANNYLATNFALGIGRKSNSKLIDFYEFNVNTVTLLDYNAAILPLFNFELKFTLKKL